MERSAKIYVAGHRGLVGTAMVKALQKDNYQNIVLKTHSELDLTNQAATQNFFENEKPDFVFLAAAKVGGIIANRDARIDFLYQNMMIEMNVLHAAAETGVRKLMFLGSSCVYPKLAKQPIIETELLSGSLESTNEAYAIAKIAGIKLAEYYHRERDKKFVSVMPCNLYGPYDQFDPSQSHVIPGLIHRFHQSKMNQVKEMVVWGTGTPLREFLYSDDLAEGCLFLMNQYEDPELINLGSGEEISIQELAELIKDIVGFEGKIIFDSSKPDGTPRKVMDSTKIRKMGWKPKVDLRVGLENTYNWYLNHYSKIENRVNK